FGELASADAPLSRSLWSAIRDATPFAVRRSPASREDERPLWRISTAPSRGAELAAMIAGGAQAQMFYDWAGGLIWVMLDVGIDAGAALIRHAMAATGGMRHWSARRPPCARRSTFLRSRMQRLPR